MEVYCTIYTDENLFTAIGIEGYVATDIALAKGGGGGEGDWSHGGIILQCYEFPKANRWPAQRNSGIEVGCFICSRNVLKFQNKKQ